MPNRSDLWTVCLGLAALVDIPERNVWRGLFFPCDLEWGPERYPAMGFRPLRETIVSGNAGFMCSGIVDLDFWIYTGRDGATAIANDPLCLKPLDDFHDKLLRTGLADSYPNLTSQTLSIYPEESDGWTPWEYIESPHAGASLRLHYSMGIAPPLVR